MNHLMLDIETLGSYYDAVVLTIGAVKFDPFTNVEPHSYLSLVLDVDEQVEKGRHISKDTLAWWGGQPKDIRNEAFRTDRSPVPDCLNKLNEWSKDCSKIWCQGPSFDMPILNSLYRDFGIELGWKFWNERDSRTITSMMRNFADYKKSVMKNAHTVIGDCVAQAKCVQESIRINHITFIG